jgi:hypothetical protein
LRVDGGYLLAASVEVSCANVGVSNDPVKERAGWVSVVWDDRIGPRQSSWHGRKTGSRVFCLVLNEAIWGPIPIDLNSRRDLT